MAQRWPSTDTSLWMDVPFGHHAEKKAKLPSARLRRIRRPRVHSPARSSLYSLTSRSASSREAQSCQRGPLVPSPDGKRRQAFLGRLCAIAEAVPDGLLLAPGMED